MWRNILGMYLSFQGEKVIGLGLAHTFKECLPVEIRGESQGEKLDPTLCSSLSCAGFCICRQGWPMSSLPRTVLVFKLKVSCPRNSHQSCSLGTRDFLFKNHNSAGQTGT